jgi:hypothetical protein
LNKELAPLSTVNCQLSIVYYWKWLKNRLIDEGSGLVSNTNQLKLPAPDGKMRLTDVADTEQVLRLVQSIPSKKAKPFKMWLAKVGNERLDETIDPELSFARAIGLGTMRYPRCAMPRNKSA